MGERPKKYAGHQTLNKREAYGGLSPSSKKHMDKMLERVLYNWLIEGRATKTSELTQLVKNQSLVYSKKPREKYRLVRPTTLLKEFLPYLPVRAGRLFIRNRKSNTRIKDEVMHKNLRKGFSKAKTRFARGHGSLSHPKLIESLNKEGNTITKEVLFFPCTGIKHVCTKEFLKKLDKVDLKRLKEWGLVSTPKKTKTFEQVSEWEREKVLNLVIKNQKKTKKHVPKPERLPQPIPA